MMDFLHLETVPDLRTTAVVLAAIATATLGAKEVLVRRRTKSALIPAPWHARPGRSPPERANAATVPPPGGPR